MDRNKNDFANNLQMNAMLGSRVGFLGSTNEMVKLKKYFCQIGYTTVITTLQNAQHYF